MKTDLKEKPISSQKQPLHKSLDEKSVDMEIRQRNKAPSDPTMKSDAIRKTDQDISRNLKDDTKPGQYKILVQSVPENPRTPKKILQMMHKTESMSLQTFQLLILIRIKFSLKQSLNSNLLVWKDNLVLIS